MSTTIKDGGPAFPLPRDENNFPATHGMTLRDYFAAKAMQSLLGALDLMDSDAPTLVFELAYMVADAMLLARSKS